MIIFNMILGAFVLLVAGTSINLGNPTPQGNSLPHQLSGPRQSRGPQFPSNQGGPSRNAIPGQGGGFPGSATDTKPCPHLPIVKDFQADKYLGRWYEIARFEAPFQSGDCGTADYSLLPNCSIGVTNTQMLENGTMDQAIGVANSGGDPTRGSLTVSFADPRSTPDPTSDEPNYNVLATDYSNYAVVHSCKIVTIPGRSLKFEFSWILARRSRVNALFLQRLKGWLKNIGLNTAMYRNTNHDNCRYSAA